MVADCHARVGTHRHPAQQCRRQPRGCDAPIEDITADAFDRVTSINLRGMVLACKCVLPIMPRSTARVIINISSMAAWGSYPYVAYKTSKAGVIALTERSRTRTRVTASAANVILPGLMNTPMAIESRVVWTANRARL